MIIHSNRVVTYSSVKEAYIEVHDGKITAMYPGKANVKADVDYGDLRIIPGIIDTHNHGAVGYRFDDADYDGLLKCLKGQAAFGVTGVLATTTVWQQYATLARISKEDNDGARLCGIHSEGPWGARVGEKGINLGYPHVDLEIAEKMVKEAEGTLKLVDVAPEVEGALEAIEFFVKNGIQVGAYHTNATLKEANRGIDAGISVATHLMNVMTGLHHRDVGVAGAALLRDEVDCELICDGLHVSLEMIELIMRMKPHDRIMLVSDNGAFLGAPVGKYDGGEKNKGSDREVLEVTEDGFVLSMTGRLTGSSKAVLYGIQNLVEKLKLDLVDVCRMASTNPARKYGLVNKGALELNRDFDAAVIDDDYRVVATYVEGRKVFDAEKEKVPFNEELIKTTKLS